MIQPLMDLELDPVITSSQEESVVDLEQEQEHDEDGLETGETTDPAIAGSRFVRFKVSSLTLPFVNLKSNFSDFVTGI